MERLSYADLPRPFKNPHGFVSKLPYRTASTTTTSVKKSTKQILVLERERIGGGDGFLPANLTRARARGEIIEPGGKKKKPIGAIPGQNRRGHNLKGRKGNGAGGGLSGVSTPNTGLGSERTTPGEEDDEDEREEGGEEEEVVLPLGKEVFTCEWARDTRVAVREIELIVQIIHPQHHRVYCRRKSTAISRVFMRAIQTRGQS